MKATAMKARILTALMAVFLCLPAYAQTACGDYDTAMAELEAKYGEVTVMRGLGSDGRMIEITKNKDGGFSIMLTDPQRGVTCMAYAGEALDFVDAPKPGNPA